MEKTILSYFWDERKPYIWLHNKESSAYTEVTIKIINNCKVQKGKEEMHLLCPLYILVIDFILCIVLWCTFLKILFTWAVKLWLEVLYPNLEDNGYWRIMDINHSKLGQK